MGQAMQTMQELGDLDQLENLLQQRHQPGRARRGRHGPRARPARRRRRQVARAPRRADQDARRRPGLIEQKEGRLELTPKGLRKIGSNALRDLFTKLTKDKVGQHQVHRLGQGHERTYETKPYEFGDPFKLDLHRTIRNALRRDGGRARRCELSARRLRDRAHRAPHHGRRTVLMLDLSLSMPMRDNFLPAKKVAMALHSLISSQFPRDYLGLVGFSETARVLTAAQLPEVSWDFVYGTNMQHGFMLARQLLAKQTGTQADHHDHRRRADRAHHARAATCSSTTRRCARRSRRRCARWCAAPATASASTRSCSMPTAA